ncbi:DUF4435 domain-containing protein [Rhizobium ecuadorense]|uniref:DUF4435 domain-containing protein n=1 Tax=Rhizobium ecuadorense TaxID=1671795 RepID=UPI000673B50C|nr:DUF4435 domain-containing protein [Rhizobium ecuadorense]
MNSVDRHLDAESKAATLLAMRSAKKEVFLIVEGDSDVDVLANALRVPRSNILSCDGKETLMAVYRMAPQKGIDEGSVFLRDRDNDDVSTGLSSGVLLLVTSRYDLEMELLENRIFQRILSEFMRDTVGAAQAKAEFDKICEAASAVGALRIYSQDHTANLDFDELKYNRFLNSRNLAVDISNAVRYIFAKSKVALANPAAVKAAVVQTLQGRAAADIVCCKEFVDVLHLALSRHYNACDARECLPSILSRTIRISAVHEDFKMMALYPPFSSHVAGCGYGWSGSPL